MRYFETDLPKNQENASKRIDIKETKEDKNRLQRFGIPIATYTTGSGVNTYNNNNGIGYTNPVKIDIGGVALGALIGLGAILILPKLANVFSSGHGYRSKISNFILHFVINTTLSLNKLIYNRNFLIVSG